MNPLVVDLSHWDPAKDYRAVKQSGIVGVIYKATEGTTYTDPTYVDQRNGAIAANLRWGAYHFILPGDIEAQAENFLCFANPGHLTLFCVDWEDKNGHRANATEVRKWIEYVEGKLGRPGECVIYSGNVAKEEIKGKDPFFGQRRLWLAQYSNSATVQQSWASYWLWQFTDGDVGPEPHTIPGIGHCDISTFAGTPMQLNDEWASGKRVPVPAPDQPTVTITIQAPAGVKVVVNQETK